MLVIVEHISHLNFGRRIHQFSPPCEHPASSLFVFNMHLLLIVRVGNTNFTQIFKGNHVTTPPRRPVSPYGHLHVRLQPAAGLASTSRIASTRQIDCVSARRSRSSCCCRVSHAVQLVFYTNTQNSSFWPMKSKLVTWCWFQLKPSTPVVSAPKTCPRRFGVRLSTMH